MNNNFEHIVKHAQEISLSEEEKKVIRQRIYSHIGMKKPASVLSIFYIASIIAVAILLIVFIKMSYDIEKNAHLEQIGNATSTLVTPKGDSVSMTHEVASSTYYTIELTYPKSSEKFLPEIYRFVQNEKEEFLNNFKNISPKEAEFLGLRSGEQWNLIIDTRTKTSAKTVSYVIQSYSYTGGAHGITNVSSFNYDIETNKLLTHADVFKADPDLYKKLSDRARIYFKNKFPQGEADSIDEGTVAKDENFGTWYITDKDIVFIFNEYSIGPYTLGIQEFPLNKVANADILSGTY